MIHDVHMVFNETLLLDLKKTSISLNKKSISGTIVEIVVRLLPVLENYQIEFQNRKSEYKKIADPKEKRHNFHIYFPEKIYMKMKELHQYLNFYSMAQIVREMLQLYLKEYYKRGTIKTMRKYEKLKNDWEIWKMKHKNADIVRQMYHNETPLHIVSVTYDVNYRPIIIKYLS